MEIEIRKQHKIDMKQRNIKPVKTEKLLKVKNKLQFLHWLVKNQQQQQ